MKKLSPDRVKNYKMNIFNEVNPEYRKILKNLDSAKEELEALKQNLNYITNPMLINQVIFEIKAAEIKYRYWFYLARTSNKNLNP